MLSGRGFRLNVRAAAKDGGSNVKRSPLYTIALILVVVCTFGCETEYFDEHPDALRVMPEIEGLSDRTITLNVETDPPGAEIYLLTPEGLEELGESPLVHRARVGLARVENGPYEPIEYVTLPEESSGLSRSDRIVLIGELSGRRDYVENMIDPEVLHVIGDRHAGSYMRFER